MQTREAVIKKLKELGVTTCRRVGPYLIWGGVATNLYILLASEQTLENQTCEKARSKLDENASLLAILNAVLVADTGIYVFNVVGATRAIVIPTTHWAYTKVAEALPSLPTMNTYQSKSLEIWESELLKAISTGMFISMLPLSRAITSPFLPIAFLPLARIFMKHRLHDYPGSASYRRYHEVYPDRPWLANTLSAVESVSTGVNLAAASSAMAWLMINAFIDSTRQQDWPYQDNVMLISAAIGMINGMLSIANERAHRASNFISEAADTFYLMDMPLIGLIYCFFQQLENTDTFMESGVYAWLAVAALTLSISIAQTCLTAEQEESEVKVEEVESEDESEEEYITFPIEPKRINWRYGTFGLPRQVNNNDSSSDDEYDVAIASNSPRGGS